MSDLFSGLFSGSLEDIPEEGASYDRPEDGVYEATVTDVYPMEGTKNFPDRRWILVDYTLDSTGTTVSDWFEMPADPANPTDKERQKLRFYINRLGDLGVPRDAINTTSSDDLIDLRVAVTLRTKGQYQNITSVDLIPDESGEASQAFDSMMKGSTPADIPTVRQSAPPSAQTAPLGRRTATRQNPFSGK